MDIKRAQKVIDVTMGILVVAIDVCAVVIYYQFVYDGIYRPEITNNPIYLSIVLTALVCSLSTTRLYWGLSNPKSCGTRKGWVLRFPSIKLLREALIFNPIALQFPSATGIATSLLSNDSADLAIGTNPGFIYVMRRADGVYKIGYSIDPDKRLKQHQNDYRQEFILVKRFIVPDVIQFERLALDMTRGYHYDEDGRNELRQMSAYQLSEFASRFEAVCKQFVMS